jgi:hypothetical protein
VFINMVLEKVHGLQATGMSMNDRFTMLAMLGSNRVPMRQRQRPNMGNFNQNLNMKNRILEQLNNRRLDIQAKRVSSVF